MAFFKEFKKFAVRGNVTDMAVGIIIGASFGKIVDSLVKDIIMPAVGMLLGKVDFSNIFFVLKKGNADKWRYDSIASAVADGAVTVNVGLFINTLISFTIVAFAVFLLIRALNKVNSATGIDLALKKACPKCFEMIDKRAIRCSHCTADLKK